MGEAGEERYPRGDDLAKGRKGDNDNSGCALGGGGDGRSAI